MIPLLAAVMLTAPPAGVTNAALRADGVLLVNGAAVLPYGLYISTGHTGDVRLRCVELAHAAGATVVHVEGPWDEDTRFLDRAAELGLHVVAGHTETEAKLPRVTKFKDHLAIVSRELRQVAPRILGGTRTKLTAGGDVTAAAWAGTGGTLVVAANLAGKPVAVDIPLPAGVGAPAAAFPGRPALLRVEGGRLVGTLPPTAVAVLKGGGE